MLKYTIKKSTAKELEELGGIVDSDFKKRANYFVAESNGKLIGKLGYVDDFFIGRGPHLFGGTLKVELEGKGVGSSLIKTLEDEARQLDIPLLLHRFSNNGGFYEKMGYHVDYECNEAHKWLHQ